MINVSTKFLNAIREKRAWEYYVYLTFRNGAHSGIVKTLRNDDLAISGCEINNSAGTSSLPLGNAIGKTLTLSLVNNDDRWSEYDFFNAEIKVEIRYFADNETTLIPLGYYYVIEPETYGSTIELTAVDAMYKSDKAFNMDSVLWPCTLVNLFREACSQAGLSYASINFVNNNYLIQKCPENKTCREIIAMCAMLFGGNAVINSTNNVQVIQYNMDKLYNDYTDLSGGSFDTSSTPYSDGDNANGGDFSFSDTDTISGGSFDDVKNYHILYKGSKITITTDDVIVTGFEITVNEKTYSVGTDGYKIGFTNELLEGNDESSIYVLLNTLSDLYVWRYYNARYSGLRFRPFEIDHVSYPIVEFGDACFVVDRRQRDYKSFITDITFSFKGYTTLKCTAESPIRNSTKYTSNETTAILVAKSLVEEEKTEREQAISDTQALINNSPGLYESKVSSLPGRLPEQVINLKLSFDELCAGENVYSDSLSLYVKYKDESVKAVFERKLLSDCAGYTPIIPYNKEIEDLEVVLRSDFTVNDWGFRINSATTTSDNVTVNPFTPYYYSDRDNADYVKSCASFPVESDHPYENGKCVLFTILERAIPKFQTPMYYVLHNKPRMEDSDIWWVASADVIYVSTDKGQSFNASISASGDAIVSRLSAEGINADWINTGSITIGGTGRNAEIVMKNASNEVIGGWTDKGISIHGEHSRTELSDGYLRFGYPSDDAYGGFDEWGYIGSNKKLVEFQTNGQYGMQISDEYYGYYGSGFTGYVRILTNSDPIRWVDLQFVNGIFVSTCASGACIADSNGVHYNTRSEVPK